MKSLRVQTENIIYLPILHLGPQASAYSTVDKIPFKHIDSYAYRES